MDIQEQQNGAPAAMPACCTLEQPCSVPFLSLDFHPPPFPPTFSTTLLPRCPLYPALRRCPLSSPSSCVRLLLALHCRFTLTNTFLCFSFSLSSLPFRSHNVTARISFFHLLHRHWTSSVLLATLSVVLFPRRSSSLSFSIFHFSSSSSSSFLFPFNESTVDRAFPLVLHPIFHPVAVSFSPT